MQLRGFRMKVALFVFFLVFALGMGVKYLHQQTRVIDPITAQLLQIPGVSSASVEQRLLGGSRVLVKLELENDAPLSTVFRKVYQTLASSGGNYAVQVQDSPDATILALFEQMQIAVEEAIMTGEFTLLSNRVERLASTAHVEWDLGLDREFIYLSLTDKDSSLRRVIRRGMDDGKVKVYPDGGVDSWTNG